MTDFSALPLAEKIKRAKDGDIVVTDSGARLAIVGKCAHGVLALLINGLTMPILDHSIFDIIRPTERKVPEVVGRLRKIAIRCNGLTDANDIGHRLTDICNAFADHFEKETP
jgi:hypothetical protein